MANTHQKNKLTSLLGDYGNNSDSELDDSFVDGGNRATTQEHDTNWTQCIDTNTGHPYYWNIVTKEVTWEIPDEYEQFLKLSAMKYYGASVANKWVLCSTDGEKEYYFNAVTREISWERPAEYVDNAVGPNDVISDHAKAELKDRLHTPPKVSTTDKFKRSNKYPFVDFEEERIELISSFSAKSESSSDDEPNRNAGTLKTKKSALLNLVADYSDQSDDDEIQVEAASKPTKPLFAAAAAETHGSGDVYSAAVQSILKSTINNTSPTEPAETYSEQEPEQKKPKTTFASIITGGRSPSQEDAVDSNAFISEDDRSDKNDQDTGNEGTNFNDVEHLSKKLFKRKRRIEFNTSRSLPMVASVNANRKEDEPTDSLIVQNGDSSENERIDSDANRPNYSNFQKCETAFVEDSDNNKSESIDALTAQLKLDICDLKDTLAAKVDFLCQDRADVSPVQVIQIQLQILLDAYDAEALAPEYVLKWLQSVSTDLTKLEEKAAPDGWKCFWDRTKSQYGYRNETTGIIQWDYPVMDAQPIEKEDNDDEMDICTTPPPNANEILPEINNLNADSITPAPPSWYAAKTALIHTHLTTGEPLPPGIDMIDYKNVPAESINQELASFYSDLASMDSTPPEGTTNVIPTAPPAPSIGSGNGTDLMAVNNAINTTDGVTDTINDKKKKKKKKTKKLEPWRSGNLESWINKWQAAQKELDG